MHSADALEEGVPRGNKRLNGRPDSEKEFFYMSVVAAKMAFYSDKKLLKQGLVDIRGLLTNAGSVNLLLTHLDVDVMYEEVCAKKIPFYEWNDWIRTQIWDFIRKLPRQTGKMDAVKKQLQMEALDKNKKLKKRIRRSKGTKEKCAIF